MNGQLITSQPAKQYLRPIGKWVHKDIDAAKILFHGFGHFLQDICKNHEENYEHDSCDDDQEQLV